MVASGTVAVCFAGGAAFHKLPQTIDSITEFLLEPIVDDADIFIHARSDEKLQTWLPIASRIPNLAQVKIERPSLIFETHEAAVSHSHSIGRREWGAAEFLVPAPEVGCLHVIEEYEHARGWEYERIIFTRPDLKWHGHHLELSYFASDEVMIPQNLPTDFQHVEKESDFMFDHYIIPRNMASLLHDSVLSEFFNNLMFAGPLKSSYDAQYTRLLENDFGETAHDENEIVKHNNFGKENGNVKRRQYPRTPQQDDVAICLHGLFHEFPFTVQSFRRNFLDVFDGENNTDVFIYAPIVNGSHEAWEAIAEVEDSIAQIKFTKEDVSHFVRQDGERNTNSTAQQRFWYTFELPGNFLGCYDQAGATNHIPHRPGSGLCQMYAHKTCLEMIQTFEARQRGGLSYGRVVQTRPDFLWIAKHQPLHMLQQDLIWIIDDDLEPGVSHLHINDRHWVFPRDKAAIMLSRWDWLINGSMSDQILNRFGIDAWFREPWMWRQDVRPDFQGVNAEATVSFVLHDVYQVLFEKFIF